MGFPDRYYSLLRRQQKKLAYAPKVIAAFEDSTSDPDLGPFPSKTSLAGWLTGKIPPSADAKDDAVWSAQTVSDWLSFDGYAPTPERIREYYAEISSLNKARRAKVLRKYGARVAIVTNWDKVETTIARKVGPERVAFEKERLERHLVEIHDAARALRAAIGEKEPIPD